MGLRSGLCNGQGITVISLHSNQTIVPLAILLQRPADQLYIRCCIQPALNHLQSPNSTCQHAPPRLDFSSLCLICRHNTVRMVLFFLPSFYEHFCQEWAQKLTRQRSSHTHTSLLVCLILPLFAPSKMPCLVLWCAKRLFSSIILALVCAWVCYDQATISLGGCRISGQCQHFQPPCSSHFTKCLRIAMIKWSTNAW